MVLGAFATACGSAASTSPTLARATPVVPPRTEYSIVLFLADDLDRDLFASMLESGTLPNIQRYIVDRGVSFTRAYAASPLCCPSRVSILTGQFPHNTGVYDNDNWEHGGFEGFFRSRRESSAMPTWFAASDVPTALIGKYLNGYPQYGAASGPAHPADVPPGWRFWFVPLQNTSFFDYSVNFNGNNLFYPRSARIAEEPENYRTDIEARRGEEFLSQVGPKKFFLFHSAIAPHIPAEAAPRHQEVSRNVAAPRPTSYNEQDVSDKPGWIQRRGLIDPQSRRNLDGLWRLRWGSMRSVDDLVGRIVARTEAIGQVNRTCYVFTSDNGWETGQHRLESGKGFMYEESVGVPLVMSCPGMRKEEIPHLASLVDLAPTFMELSGVRSDSTLDGKSLVPLLYPSRPAADQWRKDVLIEFLSRDRSESPAFYQLRTSRYSIAAYSRDVGTPFDFFELYDMENDPQQLRSLDYHSRLSPTNPEYRPMPPEFGTYVQRLEALRRCAGASCY